MHGKGILFACAEKIAPIKTVDKTFWKGGQILEKKKKCCDKFFKVQFQCFKNHK